jgi:hypothetical protein
MIAKINAIQILPVVIHSAQQMKKQEDLTMNTMMMTRMMAEDCGVPELRGYSSNGSERSGLIGWFRKLLGK